MIAKRLPLKENFSWTLLGNVVYAGCLWGILAVFTKLGTGDIVGRYALASAIATPVIVFANLQLRSVLAADAGNRHHFGEYLAVRLFLLPLAFVVVVVVATVAYRGELALVIALFALARITEGVSDICYGLAQQNERLDLVGRSLMIKGPAGLVFVAGIFAVTGSLPWALVGLIAGWLVPLLVFDLPQAARLLAADNQRFRPAWNRRAMGQIAWLALPLGLVMLLIQLQNTIPRTILANEWGEAAVGYFAALSYLIIAGSTVVLALGQSALAPLSRLVAEGRLDRFRRLVGGLLLLGITVGILGVVVAVLIGRELLTVLYTADYGQYSSEFVVIMGAGGLAYVSSLLGPTATSLGAFRGQLVIQAINVCLLLGLGFWLIPAHGIAGAAWTILGGAAWVVVGFVVLIAWKLKRVAAAHALGERGNKCREDGR